MNDLAQMVALLVRYPELEKEELLKYVGLYVRIEIKLQALEIAKEYQVDIALLLDSSCEEEYLNRCCNRYLASGEKLGYKRLGADKFDLLKEVLL